MPIKRSDASIDNIELPPPETKTRSPGSQPQDAAPGKGAYFSHFQKAQDAAELKKALKSEKTKSLNEQAGPVDPEKFARDLKRAERHSLKEQKQEALQAKKAELRENESALLSAINQAAERSTAEQDALNPPRANNPVTLQNQQKQFAQLQQEVPKPEGKTYHQKEDDRRAADKKVREEMHGPKDKNPVAASTSASNNQAVVNDEEPGKCSYKENLNSAKADINPVVAVKNAHIKDAHKISKQQSAADLPDPDAGHSYKK